MEEDHLNIKIVTAADNVPRKQNGLVDSMEVPFPIGWS